MARSSFSEKWRERLSNWGLLPINYSDLSLNTPRHDSSPAKLRISLFHRSVPRLDLATIFVEITILFACIGRLEPANPYLPDRKQAQMGYCRLSWTPCSYLAYIWRLWPAIYLR